MNTLDQMKGTIDRMSYEELLRRWRLAPIGDPMFRGEVGEYYSKRMAELRSQPGGDAIHVAASKSIGWNR